MNRLAVPALLAVGLAWSAPAASRGAHYHLANPGMCNKTDKQLLVSYAITDANRDSSRTAVIQVLETDAIFEGSPGTHLGPGRCATMDIVVTSTTPPTGVGPPHERWAEVTFYADNAHLTLRLSADKHEIHRQDNHQSDTIHLHSNAGKHEHFHIEIQPR